MSRFAARLPWRERVAQLQAHTFTPWLVKELALVKPLAWPELEARSRIVFRLIPRSIRCDATSERLSTLSPYTINVLNELAQNYQEAENKRPVRIEAFVSTKVPEIYLQTR